MASNPENVAMPFSGESSDLEAQRHLMDKPVVASWEAAVRADFIGKVYSLLSMQLLVTLASAAIFMFDEQTRNFVLAPESVGLRYLALFLPFGFLLGLHCTKNARQHPLEMVLLGGFTLSLAYSVGIVCAMYYAAGYGMLVFQAVLLTSAVFLSITAYVLITKKDFTYLGAGLFAGLLILFIWGFVNVLFPIPYAGVRAVFSLLGALLFAGYLIYDTSNIVHVFGPDDYVEASIALYLDIINLFMYLLQLLTSLGGGSRA